MRRIIATMGLPRSGKSTWIQEMIKSHGYPVVSRDAVRLALHGKRFLGTAEPMVKVIANVMIDALFEAGHETVLIDETNTTLARRNGLRKKDREVVFKVFGTCPATCRDRARDTGQDDLLPIIQAMAENFEPLEHDEVEYSG